MFLQNYGVAFSAVAFHSVHNGSSLEGVSREVPLVGGPPEAPPSDLALITSDMHLGDSTDST